MTIFNNTKRTAADYPHNILANIGYYEAIDHHHFVTEYMQQAKGDRDIGVAVERCLDQMLAKGYDTSEMGVVIYDKVTHAIYIGKNETNRENGKRMTLKLITCVEVQRVIDDVVENGQNEWTVTSSINEKPSHGKIVKLKDIYDKVLMGLVFQFGLQHILESGQAVSLGKFDGGIARFFNKAEDLFEWNGTEFEVNFAFLNIH